MISDLFRIDLRALALYRIAAGMMLVTDLIIRAPGMSFWLGESTFYPADLAQEALLLSFSIHVLSDAMWFQWLLFSLALIAAVSLCIGFKSKLSAAISWYLLSSLHLRNLNMLDVGDHFFILSLLWLIFLPSGQYWSVDSKGKSLVGTQILSFASAGLLLQPALAFFFAAIAKLHGNFWWDGTAVLSAVGDDVWSQPFGLWFVESPTRVAIGTYFTLILELFGPVLLFIPTYFRYIRPPVLIAFIIFLIGMGSCLKLQLIPFMTAITLIPFMPSSIIDKVCGVETKPTDISPFENSWIQVRIPIFLLFSMFILNFNSASLGKLLPQKVVRLAQSLRLNQGWTMYSPDPPFGNFRMILDLQLQNGTKKHLAIGAIRQGWPHMETDEDLEHIWNDYRMRIYFQEYKGHASELEKYDRFLRWYCTRHENIRHIGLRKIIRSSPTVERHKNIRSLLDEEKVIQFFQCR